MTEVDFRGWFSPEELTSCPRCRRQTLVSEASNPYPYCLECGLLGPDGAIVGETFLESLRAHVRAAIRKTHPDP